MKRWRFWCLFLTAALAGGVGRAEPMPIETVVPDDLGSADAIEGENVGYGDSCCSSSWLDSTEIFVGGDAYAALGEFPAGGFGNNFGLVSGANTSFGVGESGIRAQLGGSYGIYDLKGRGGGINANDPQHEVFVTAGVSQRADVCCGQNFSWGVVVDAFYAENWGLNATEVDLGQARFLAGYAIDACNELGVWGTFNLWEDRVLITGRGIRDIRAMNQLNAYWSHDWEFGTETMLYAGVLDNADVGDWVFGFTGRAPLSCCADLYGGFNYVVPSASTGVIGDTEDAWNVNFGIVFYVGAGGDRSGSLPLLPVANHSNFLVTD